MSENRAILAEETPTVEGARCPGGAIDFVSMIWVEPFVLPLPFPQHPQQVSTSHYLEYRHIKDARCPSLLERIGDQDKYVLLPQRSESPDLPNLRSPLLPLLRNHFCKSQLDLGINWPRLPRIYGKTVSESSVRPRGSRRGRRGNQVKDRARVDSKLNDG